VSQQADPPSVGVLLAGAVGVLVVVGFVAAVAMGGEARSRPGDRVELIRGEGPAGLEVLAGRCPDERITAVELRAPQGPTLWRVASDKGSITRRYVVGDDPPFGFATVHPLQPVPDGLVEAVVEIDGESVDSEVFQPPIADEGSAAGPCGRSQGIGAVALLFAGGAALVVVAYGGMLRRWLAGRRRP
jgi:hypothetical protein